MSQRIHTGRRKAMWYAAVMAAQERASIMLPHEIEGYLVITLNALQRAQFPDLFAVALLKHVQSGNLDKLRAVANKALLHSGLYPNRARRLGLARDYFTDIARAAFYQLFMQYDTRHHDATARMYHDLYGATPQMVQVLRHLRETPTPST